MLLGRFHQVEDKQGLESLQRLGNAFQDLLVLDGIKEIEENLLAVKWIALEELISLLYKDFNHPEKKEAIEFFRERNLVI